MENNKPVLVILSPGFPKDELDSTCLPSQQLLVNSINQQYPGLEVIVFAFDYPFVMEQYQWRGITIIPFNGKKNNKPAKLLVMLKIWRTLKQINKTRRLIGIMSFWCGICAWVGNSFSKKYKLQHLCWIPGQDAKKSNKYVARIKPRPEQLMAISDFIQQEFEKNHAIRPAHVIPNGIDPTLFANVDDKKQIDVLAAGSLIGLKRYDIFIAILKELKIDVPDIKAKLCGKGPEYENLFQQINEYKLEDNVQLEGELSHSELLREMKKAKLFLHTSNYEGFSTVCIEALHAGVPVISFCRAMNEEIENWYIVDSKDEMIFKARAILKNLPRAFSNCAFDIRHSADKIMGLFNYKE